MLKGKLKFLLPLLAIIIIIPLLAMGCVDTEPATSTKDTSQDQRLSKLETGLANLTTTVSNIPQDTSTVKQADIDNLNNKIATQTEKIEALQADVSRLEDEIDSIDTSSSSSNNGSSSDNDYGELVDEDRSLKLYLKTVDPSSDPAHLNDGGDNVEFECYVVNTDNDSHDFMISLRLTPEDPVKVNQGNTDVTSYPTLASSWTVTRSDWDTTSNEGTIYFEPNDDKWIDDNDAEECNIVVTIDADDDVFWSYRLFIEEVD